MYFSKLLLADIIAYGVAHGADEAELCHHLEVELPEQIKPEEQVSYHKMVAALSLTRQTIQDDYLGLHLGESLMLRAKTQVDEIMRNSATIEEAFANAVSYSKLISDALKSKMVKEGHYTKISFEVNPDWAVLESHAVQQIIDMTLVCTLQSIHWLTHKKYFPTAVHLNNPGIKNKQEYYRVFDCRIKFKEAIPCIIFRSQILDQSLPASNPSLLAALTEEANKELEKIQAAPPLIIQIKEIILGTLPQRSNVKHLATELHLSSRTLQRKLKLLKTSFKEIEKELLLKLTKKLLVHEGRNIDEIAYLLGFSAGSALIRFFKNEMNTTPKKYKTLMTKTLKSNVSTSSKNDMKFQ